MGEGNSYNQAKVGRNLTNGERGLFTIKGEGVGFILPNGLRGIFTNWRGGWDPFYRLGYGSIFVLGAPNRSDLACD